HQLQREADRRGERQDADHTDQQQERVLARRDVRHRYFGLADCASSSIAPRARSRNAAFDSSALTRIGAPKVIEHSRGSGMISAWGSTRPSFSSHTGTNSTSRRWLARWYRPLLNGS